MGIWTTPLDEKIYTPGSPCSSLPSLIIFDRLLLLSLLAALYRLYNRPRSFTAEARSRAPRDGGLEDLCQSDRISKTSAREAE